METSNTTFVHFLSRVPLFRQIEQVHLEQIADVMNEQRFEAGSTILHQGDAGKGLYLLLEGRAVVQRRDSDGNVREVDVLEPFDFFGELSLLDSEPITASIVTHAPCLCLVLPKALFLEKLRAAPEMAVGMLLELASRHRRIVSQ